MYRVIQYVLAMLFAVCVSETVCLADPMPRVRMETNFGSIVIELNSDKAPKSVNNFLYYVKTGFYEGTVFHRVIRNFMIQGGGFELNSRGDLVMKETRRRPVENEGGNGLKNVKYSVALARTSDPHSATSQFFINTAKNDFLNFKAPMGNAYGYAVFGKVISGFDVVDRIALVPTHSASAMKDVPYEPVKILRVVPVLN
ncbi:MAG: peptidylprolyl isomerase [Desulfovibrionaceae bacterium]|nr:peptidylprolyl isomerase [Desulfovibrionaceae bacterium]